MRASRHMVTLSGLLLVALSRRVEAQASSTALSVFLAERCPAIVYIRSTRAVPNGLAAEFAGSGFVISSDGYVITAAHVVDGIDRGTLGVSHAAEVNPEWKFSFQGSLGSTTGDPHPMHLVKLDDLRDLALLRMDEVRDYPHFLVANSDGVGPTDSMLALGFPVGSSSVIPAFGRVTSQSRSDGRWSIDAPVNHGHSGGPVVRRDGKVVAVVHAGIQGATLMNLAMPFAKGDPLLAEAHVAQDAAVYSPGSSDSALKGSTGDDLPREGSCSERAATFDQPASGLHWVCVEVVVPRGVKEHIEKTRTARLLIPGSAEITAVRYFHRSRGDWQQPLEFGPWHVNPPDVDLQWMLIDRAEIIHTGGDQIVEADCHNWSDGMSMSCALGVQYRSGAWLW